MAGFTEGALSKKLAELNSSQQSIQTLSLWLIHHRKHHATIVKVWFKELQKAKDSRKLVFMYLANDVIQNSKKKGPEFGKEFGNVLRRAFENMAVPENDEKTRRSLGRILDIWQERGVYDERLISDFKKGLEAPKGDREMMPPPKKRSKSDVQADDENCANNDKSSGRDKNHRSSHHAKERPAVSKSPVVALREHKKSETEVEVEVDGQKELHVTLSPRTPAGDPPEPEELIKALQDLESSASFEGDIREKISSLPPEVSEVQLLSKLQDKKDADELSDRVNEAVQLLTDYNARLANEMEERKKVTSMLRDFIQAQRDLLAQAEHRLEEYTDKLQKVFVVKQELKSHIQNLPDLTQLPDVTGGLAPLPSAGDLFSLH